MAFFGSSPAPPPSRLDELKRILQRDPTSRQFLALAEEYRRQGKLRDAIITLERGLTFHTSSVAAHVALGKVYQQLERFEDATRAFHNALRYDRENLVAIRHLAEVYLGRGEKLEAVKKLKLYRGLKPGDREVHELIARLEAELEPPAPEPFPSGIRSLRGGAAALAPPFVPPVPREDAGVSSTAGPFDLPPEPVWQSPAWEQTAEPPWLPSEEVFPTPAVPVREELAEPSPPAPVPSAPETPVFLETEFAPPEEPAELEQTVRSPAAAPPDEEHAPEPAPDAAFDSGVRRGPPLRERYEAPAPIEMTPEPPAIPFEVSAPAAPGATVEAVAFEVSTEPAPAFAFSTDVTETPEAEPARDDSAGESPTVPLVTETLAELYRSQGYLQEARQVYLTLAALATDPEAGNAYTRKAEALGTSRANELLRRRLEVLLSPFAPPPPLATLDLSALLRSLMAEIPGLRAAALTDREGLPVVTEGFAGNGEALEVLVAELTSFVKNVGRSGAEIGGGTLRSLAVVGECGTAVLANVTPEYALILEAEPEAALGEVRWAAARAAERLRPAVG